MPTPIDPSSLHTIRWTRRADVRWPYAIELALSACQDAMDAPAGALYNGLFAGAPLADAEQARQRRKRSDGGINALSLLSAMIASADLTTGYVARPAGSGWERKTYYELDGLAYGEQVPGARSFRRTERAAQQLVALGLIRSVRLKAKTPAGVIDVPGAKWVTERAWRLLGAWSAVRRERRRRKAAEAEARAAQLLTSIGAGQAGPKTSMPALASIPLPAIPTTADPDPPDAVDDPPPPACDPEIAQRHLEAIAQLFK